jgi:hypothetical protein
LGSTGDLRAERTVGDNIDRQTFTFKVSRVHAVKILLPSNNFLQLAEVEVKGTPGRSSSGECLILPYDAECQLRTQCSSGRCNPLRGKCDCDHHADCPEKKPYCSDGKCLSKNLTYLVQCQEDNQCSSGKCKQNGVELGKKCKCVQKTDCPTDQPFCGSSGLCLSGNLHFMAQCEFFDQCSSGKCDSTCGCGSNEECDPRFLGKGFCSPSSGLCLNGPFLSERDQCKFNGQCDSNICTGVCRCGHRDAGVGVGDEFCPTNDRPVCSTHGLCEFDRVIKGVASQSSTLATGAEAFRAIDGHNNTGSFTKKGHSGIWQMEFNAVYKGYTVTTVLIQSLSRAVVALIDRDRGMHLASARVLRNPGHEETLKFDIPGIIGIIIIQNKTEDYLQIFEVEVRGTPA